MMDEKTAFVDFLGSKTKSEGCHILCLRRIGEAYWIALTTEGAISLDWIEVASDSFEQIGRAVKYMQEEDADNRFQTEVLR